MADDKADFEVELVDDVSRPARKAESAIARLKKSLMRFNDSALGKATQKLASFTKTSVTVGAAIGGALTAGVASLTVGMVDFGQRSRQAFSLLAKEGEVPEQLFQRSIALAASLGLNIKDTTKQIQKFRALQFSQGQAEALIKMGADMQALGASGEEVSRIFAQLGQIKAKNRLQQEELTTLAESGVSTQVVYAALAKQLGKTEDQVKALVSAGKISGSEALNAIGTAILVKTGTKEFGEAGKMMAENTLSGMTNVLKAKSQVAFLKIADSAAPAINAAAGALFGELNRFLDSQAGKDFAAGIGTAVSMLAEGMKAAIPFVKAFLSGFGEGAVTAFAQVAAAFRPVFDMLTKGDGQRGIAIMRSLGETLGVLTVLLGGVTVAFGGLLAGMTLMLNTTSRILKSVFDVFTNTLGAIIGGVTDWWANLSAIWDSNSLSLGAKAIELGRQIVMGLVNGIKAMATLPIEAIRGVAMGAINAAKSTLGIKSPSKVFADIGENTALGFQKGLGSLPTQNVIHSTVGNDNGMQTRGNLPARAPSVATGNGGRSITIGRVQIVVQVAPGATPQDARAQGEAAADGFYSRIHEYFDDIAIEEAV